MSLLPYCIFQRGRSPILAAAIHNGHDLREDVSNLIALPDAERLREEDDFTGEWTQIAKTQIVGLRSRFEVDLNRPREKAVYQSPEDAWGLQIWQAPPERSLVESSLGEYDEFYQTVEKLLRELLSEHGRLVLYDIHTYNHRRNGPDEPPALPIENPEVNVGTGTMDRKFWSPIIDRFMRDLRSWNFQGRSLDVRENVRFRGGYFGRWIHETFPERVCAIAIEVKKFFMDEWTGEGNPDLIENMFHALQSTLPGVQETLQRMNDRDGIRPRIAPPKMLNTREKNVEV